MIAAIATLEGTKPKCILWDDDEPETITAWTPETGILFGESLFIAIETELITAIKATANDGITRRVETNSGAWTVETADSAFSDLL